MRTKTLTAVLACALLLTACASPEHRGGDAAPAGSAPAPSTPASASATSVTASTAASATAVSSTAPSNGGTAAPVLGPLGYGALRLGMSKQEALATGVVTAFASPVAAGACAMAELRAAPAGKSYVMLSARLGIAAIQAWPALATAEGVHTGTSAAEARRAYPNWYTADGTMESGRHYPKVPGNDNAVYRIATDNNMVTSVTLQLARQDCYE